ALESLPRTGAGIRFVAIHQCCPLCGGHGAGARVGQQVDRDLRRTQAEDVVARPLECRGALRARRHRQRLDHLDAKWLEKSRPDLPLGYGWAGGGPAVARKPFGLAESGSMSPSHAVAGGIELTIRSGQSGKVYVVQRCVERSVQGIVYELIENDESAAGRQCFIGSADKAKVVIW